MDCMRSVTSGVVFASIVVAACSGDMLPATQLTPSGAAGGGVAAAPVAGTGGAAAAPTMPAADYSVQDNWLCRPGRTDACSADLSATVIAADGTMTPEPFVANPAAPI